MARQNDNAVVEHCFLEWKCWGRFFNSDIVNILLKTNEGEARQRQKA